MQFLGNVIPLRHHDGGFVLQSLQDKKGPADRMSGPVSGNGQCGSLWLWLCLWWYGCRIAVGHESNLLRIFDGLNGRHGIVDQILIERW